MVLVVQVIVGVWAAWVGWGRGEVVVVVVAHRQVGNSPLNRFGSVAIMAQESCTQRKCLAVG